MAGQFIADTVITLVLEGIKTFVNLAFTGIALMLEQLFPSIDVISTNPLQISVGTAVIDFFVAVSDSDLKLQLSNTLFDFGPVLSTLFYLGQETLSVDDLTFGLLLSAMYGFSLNEIVTVIAVSMLANDPKMLPVILPMVIGIGYLLYLGNTEIAGSITGSKPLIGWFHFGVFVGLLSEIILHIPEGVSIMEFIGTLSIRKMITHLVLAELPWFVLYGIGLIVGISNNLAIDFNSEAQEMVFIMSGVLVGLSLFWTLFKSMNPISIPTSLGVLVLLALFHLFLGFLVILE